MAKRTKRVSINNAKIVYDEGKIIETTKDGNMVYDLHKILRDFDNLEGVKFSIAQDVEIEPDDIEY